ncbi:MAG: ABC transporter permease [Planctomycetota bacterium]|nr:MAG: ABC transporter permease [Planctomycetota bacterium]
MTSELRRFLVGLSLGVALLLALGGALLGGTRRPRADFAFANQQEIESLDPAEATGVPSARILTALLEGLTRRDAAGRIQPGVAEHWSVSDDGLLWTFKLRDNATWSDGRPVLAEHMVGALRRLLDPATASRHAKLLWAVEGAEAYTSGTLSDFERVGLRSVGAHTVEIRLHRPLPTLPQVLAAPQLLPVPPGLPERLGRAWTRPENFVGNGPFLLVERRLRDRLRLVRNPNYWGAHEVGLESVTAYSADGLTTQLNLYLTGVVDWIIKPPPTLVDELSAREDLLTGAQFGTTFLRFNVHGAPFTEDARPTPLSDPRVRTALTLALDRDSLARDVMRGGHEAINSFVPGGLPDYTPAVLPPCDPERARALLADAGFPGGEGFPELRLLYPHNETNRDFCDAIATQWRRELGIDTRMVQQIWKVYLDSTRSGLYQVSWGAWIGDWLDAASFVEIFHSGSGDNRTGWHDTEFDDLITRASAATDMDTRNTLTRAAEERLLQALPIAPVYQRVNINLVSPRIAGWEDNLLDLHPLRDVRLADPSTGAANTGDASPADSAPPRDDAR